MVIIIILGLLVLVIPIGACLVSGLTWQLWLPPSTERKSKSNTKHTIQRLGGEVGKRDFSDRPKPPPPPPDLPDRVVRVQVEYRCPFHGKCKERMEDASP